MPEQSIIVSVRVGFTAVYQIVDRMRGVDFPVELALPHRYDDWKQAWSQSDEMLGALEKTGVNIVTVHATQAKIHDEYFFEWGRQTIKIAEHFGAHAITVHPKRAKKNKGNAQELARLHLRELQRETPVVISVETFTGKDRVFEPEEIIKAKLSMTLDTAHIHDNDRIMRIIDNYWQNIPVIHLSARSQGKKHLPIDEFCIQVVRKLVYLGWLGTIVLEYLPWHHSWYHYCLRSDLKLVQQALYRDISPEEIPPNL